MEQPKTRWCLIQQPTPDLITDTETERGGLHTTSKPTGMSILLLLSGELLLMRSVHRCPRKAACIVFMCIKLMLSLVLEIQGHGCSHKVWWCWQKSESSYPSIWKSGALNDIKGSLMSFEGTYSTCPLWDVAAEVCLVNEVCTCMENSQLVSWFCLTSLLVNVWYPIVVRYISHLNDWKMFRVPRVCLVLEVCVGGGSRMFASWVTACCMKCCAQHFGRFAWCDLCSRGKFPGVVSTWPTCLYLVMDTESLWGERITLCTVLHTYVKCSGDLLHSGIYLSLHLKSHMICSGSKW